MNNSILLSITLVCAALVAVFMVANIVRTVKGQETSKPVTRGLYLAGLVAAACNAVRVYSLYAGSKGTMLMANIVVIVCLLVSFFRSERGEPEIAEGE